MRELEYLKKELLKLKLDVASEANEFSFKLESVFRKLKEAIKEIDESKELEMKLVVTISYVDFLQNKLKSVKEMDKRVQGDGSAKQLEGRLKKKEESEDSIVLQTITEELEAARKELALLKHVTVETDRLKEKEGKLDSIVQNGDSKILRAKSKLEVVSAAEEKARSIVMSLSHTLEKIMHLYLGKRRTQQDREAILAKSQGSPIKTEDLSAPQIPLRIQKLMILNRIITESYMTECQNVRTHILH
ncbi:hypothetical protein JHK85_001177 [Glycine max]|nr:hypothetical protein JHK85_001177 [Glycine max]KAG5088531.1 hypothetical protein JHK86_001143 [Glycine max]